MAPVIKQEMQATQQMAFADNSRAKQRWYRRFETIGPYNIGTALSVTPEKLKEEVCLMQGLSSGK